MDFAELGFTPGEEEIFTKRFRTVGVDVATSADILPPSKYLFFRVLRKKRIINGSKKNPELSKRRLFRRIFARALEIILRRVANGDTFVTPHGEEVYVRAIPDEAVKKLRQNGHYSDLDIRKTGYKLPEVVYVFKSRKKHPKRIALPKEIRRELFDNLESGKVILNYELNNNRVK